MSELLDIFAAFDQIETIAALCIECTKSEKEADDVLCAIKSLARAGRTELQKISEAEQKTTTE